jgi:hypothetical protein
VETESNDVDRFWTSAEPFLALSGVSSSTMMGLPCLRIDGQFFASYDRGTGDLLVKLDAARGVAYLRAADHDLESSFARCPGGTNHSLGPIPGANIHADGWGQRT